MVQKKFPEINVNLPQFALFVKAFVLRNHLEEQKMAVPGVDIKVLAIPEKVADDFLEQFSEKFKYRDEIESTRGGSTRGEKREFETFDDSADHGRKMAKTEVKQNAINESGLELYNK